MLRCSVLSQRLLHRRRYRIRAQCLSSDHQRRYENATRLRALRKKQSAPATSAAVDDDGVNYRYRKDTAARDTLSSLWGKEDTNKKSKKVLHFFDEVDEYIAAKKRQQEQKASLSALFEGLGDPPKVKPSTPSSSSSRLSDLVLSPGEQSIFDSFPIPEPRQKSPNAFEEEDYRQYLALLEEVIESDKYQRKHTKRPLSKEYIEPIANWLRRDELTLEYSLPTLDHAVKKGVQQDTTNASDLRNELEQQRVAFLEKTGMDTKQYSTAMGALIALGAICGKRGRSPPLEIAWEKVKESGMLLGEEALNNYLYVLTMYGFSKRSGSMFASGGSILDILDPASSRDNNSTESTDKSTESETEDKGIVDTPEEVATLHDILFAPTEQSLSVRVKALVANGDGRAAESLLETSEHEELKLRTYLPILRLYLDQQDMSSALTRFKRMRDTPSVLLEPETYVQLVSGIAENGYFSPASRPISGAEEIGYSPASGPRLFDQLVTAMAEDVLEITSASARRLYGAFEKANRGNEHATHLVELHPLAPLKTLNDRAEDNEIVASRVTLDTDSGQCPRTGARLRLITLEESQRKQLETALLGLSETQFDKFMKEQQERNKVNAAEELARFVEWLDTREGPPFTAIIDGANVAYYMQNFDQGKFSFHQIKFMVDALEKMNETPLVILPYKYCMKYFNVMRGNGMSRQYVDGKERKILDDLQQSGKLYRVPPACLDDYYWMLASISDQTVARRGASIYVPPENEESRWAGARPMLISNDQMRDHKLAILEPRLFRRWYATHIVNYNFTGFVGEECVDGEIGFSTADFFSREIQGNPSPADGSTGATAWHFPVSDWEASERFCVRLPF